LPETTVVGGKESFADLGMGSLLAVELRNRLQADLGRAFPLTLIADYPTIEALTLYLVSMVRPSMEASYQTVDNHAGNGTVAVRRGWPRIVDFLTRRRPS